MKGQNQAFPLFTNQDGLFAFKYMQQNTILNLEAVTYVMNESGY